MGDWHYTDYFSVDTMEARYTYAAGGPVPAELLISYSPGYGYTARTWSKSDIAKYTTCPNGFTK